jgi:heme-degrading monooxygenase HmoA
MSSARVADNNGSNEGRRQRTAGTGRESITKRVQTMFIAMNRFRIAEGRERDFEKIWRERESYLEEVPGFREFHLLRGPEGDGWTLYSTHAVWESREAFEAWTDSEAFRKAHAGARAPEGTIMGPPQFEGFKVVL